MLCHKTFTIVHRMFLYLKVTEVKSSWASLPSLPFLLTEGDEESEKSLLFPSDGWLVSEQL